MVKLIKSPSETAREGRSAQALRENLKRRKAQFKARAQSKVSSSPDNADKNAPKTPK